ncbi:hypothetical protein AGMMS50212_12210 [Spirochaetia bacterium]|nr:hypothetical protein AGMMS50212_12210 [Spirochaetia bacterium]
MFIFAGCTFDYGEAEAEESQFSDITMEKLEYVRVRNRNPIAKLEAELGERYEKRHLMELKNYSFAQYDTARGEIDAVGSGGKASVQMDSGDVKMSEGIHIGVEAEDIVIDTRTFEWRDKEKTLTGGLNEPVDIERSDGTQFTGKGFSSDVRSRTWVFSDEVGGIYVNEDEDEEDGVEEESGEEGEAGEVVEE